MSFFDKINAIWARIGLVQRAFLAAIVLACILIGLLLTRWAARPEMRLLFGNLDLEQASRIADKISEQNIPYELRGGGGSVYVPAEKVYELRAMLAREGLLPRDGEPGYEIFDNEKLGVSPLVQKLNYNRALQGELARTIQVFDGIEFARVHIVRPEQTLFTGSGQKASASVMVRMKPGWRISNTTVAAITNLVSGAVEGLSPEQVTVADSQGRIFNQNAGENSVLSGAGGYLDFQSSIEAEMSARLQRSLEAVLGPGRSTVLAKAVVDMSSETVVSTTYEKGMPSEETIEESSTVKQETISDGEGGAQSVPGVTEKTSTTTSKYHVPETVTTKTKAPGQVTNWSVSVLADLTPPKAVPLTEGEGEGKTPTADSADGGTEMIMTVEDVKDVIRTAIGPELLKEENLTVKHVPFYQPVETAVKENGLLDNLDDCAEIIRQASMGVLGICALLALRIFTRAGRKGGSSLSAGGVEGLAGGGLPMLPPGEEGAAAMRKLIAAQIRQNPEQVRMLFSSWLAEDH